jgi:hypothetical protein
MEKREFRIDKAILYSIIQNQAGTLDKAILELVMNAVDGRSSEVFIELDTKCFKVSDDGKGFVSRFEIENFFETFGTPHKDGDATFGKYRMGRGQIMAFTRNMWRSGEFQMEVDIKNEGLNYGLKEGLALAPGCTISGTMYEELKPSELHRICRDIGELCKYISIPVFLNGERVSLKLEEEKWTFVDDNAYYKLLENARGLEVYNLGAFVKSYPPSQFGIGGRVISKQQLQVNFARNDVLQSKCTVFKAIGEAVRTHVRSTEGKKERKTGTYKDLVATRLMAGDIDNEAEFENTVLEEKLFIDVRGAQYSAQSLLKAIGNYTGNLTFSPAEGNLRADKLHQETLALVLAQKTLTRFGVHALEDLFAKMLKAADMAGVHRYGKSRRVIEKLQHTVREFERLAVKISDDRKLVDVKTLKREEKLVFDAVQASQWPIYCAFDKRGHSRKQREIRVGESDSAAGWTDGEMFIAINRNLLHIGGRAGEAMRAFEKIGTLLLHEYDHTSEDTTSHGHDPEFFELYEGVSCGTGAIGDFIHHALGRWLAALQQEKKRAMRRGETDEMDRYAELNRGSELDREAA